MVEWRGAVVSKVRCTGRSVKYMKCISICICVYISTNLDLFKYILFKYS